MWKQIVGDKILIDDLKNVDKSAFNRLQDQYPDGGPELDKAVMMYFDNTMQQVKYIRQGMDIALGGKLNSIAYLPLTDFIDRINGMPDYTID